MRYLVRFFTPRKTIFITKGLNNKTVTFFIPLIVQFFIHA